MTQFTVGPPVLAGLVATALLFDFLNGLHDSANSIATVVATRVLRPFTAVLFASFFNFIAFSVFGLHVAATMGSGVVNAAMVDPLVVFGALTGAIVWNVLTWWLGIPSSSSHALVGGLIGAGMAKAGPVAVVWGGVGIIGSAIVLSPLIGFLLAMILVLATSWLAVRATPFAVDRRFRHLQFVSSSLLSLAHGGNDAQKTMGIITVLLYSLGTLCGGWRIVRTMGSRITHLTPMQGFCAETGGALALFGATWLGVPVSTTHTITGSIVGVGSARRVSAVRWGVARGIIVAWCLTLPASAAVAALCYWLAAA